jgi:hypothetical protein
MRQVLATVATAALLVTAGCGGPSYERRIGNTINEMRYRKRLDDNLMPAAKGKAEQLAIFIRPPKNLQGPAKEFQLLALEPGKFDLSETFFEKDKLNLHVLARVKRPRDPSKKKAAPKPEDAVVRGEFIPDVIAILNSVYNVEIDSAKAKQESKRNNTFKHLMFEGNGKTVQVYFYGSKTSECEAALIYEYPKAEQANLVSKIDLNLGSFAVGERAKRSFSGAVTEEEQAGPATTGPGVF